jgi:hypothetical protein
MLGHGAILRSGGIANTSRQERACFAAASQAMDVTPALSDGSGIRWFLLTQVAAACDGR